LIPQVCRYRMLDLGSLSDHYGYTPRLVQFGLVYHIASESHLYH